MAWMMAAAVVGGALIGSMGSQSAADTQAGAQQQAAATQAGMFNTINQQEQPYIQGGYGALNSLLYGLGITPSNNGSGAPGYGGGGYGPGNNPYVNAGATAIPGGGTTTSGYMPTPDGGIQQLAATNTGVGANQNYRSNPVGSPQNLAAMVRPSGNPATANAQPTPGGTNGGMTFGQLTSNFTPQDFLNNLDPGYQFQLQTGGQAVRNADTPGVGALSGAALKDLMGFNQGMAATGYQNAYNRWQTTNQNIFSRLSGIAGLGQNAASNVGTQGTTLGTGIAQAQAAAGGSLAAGTVGTANALSNSSIPLAYLMSGNQGGTPYDMSNGPSAGLAANNLSNYGYPSSAGT